MSPELVFQISKFFKKLSDIAPTIVITGNHDCNMNNPNRMDVLSPIIDNLNHESLHYLKESGVYHMADVSFAVMGIFDKPSTYIKAKDFESKTKIALFHGAINASKTDFGYTLPSKMKSTTFKGYDLTMLGDIHKFQYLNRSKTIAYPGSLICQNHGESLVKGFIKWDVKTRVGEFKQIKNDYGYYTLDVDDGKLPIVDDMPSKARLRLRLTNTDNAELKVLLADVRKTYGIQDIAVNHVDSISKQKQWNRGGSLDVGDVSDPDYQNKLIKDYINRNFNVTPKLLDTILDINTSLNRDLPPSEVIRNTFWKLKKFKFSNMFSYGEDNIVDFEKLDGIVGLFAPNATGKSSLLDALSFCLFDTSSRAFKAINIMNNKKNSFECEVSLDINDVEYGIKRTAVRQSKGTVTVKVDF